MPQPERVFAAVGLGSNLHNPAEQIGRAFDALATLSDTTLLARSPLYRSVAIGADGRPARQPYFCNAAALLETRLPPMGLLQALQELEAKQGRMEQPRWSARSLDLDLLVYGDHVLDQPGLTVPHPRLAIRNFVLYPLRDIAANLYVPGLGRVGELAARLGTEGLQPWQD